MARKRRKPAKKKGRAPREVEFLRMLKELSGIEGVQAFAKACGKQVTNMSNYLTGKLRPGKEVLIGCMENTIGWDVEPLMELAPISKKLGKLPKEPGVYAIYSSAGTVLYIGQAENLRAEIRQTLGRGIPHPIRLGPDLGKKKPSIRQLATYLSLYRIEAWFIRHNVEALLLRVFANQTYNSNVGHFKKE